MLRPLALLWLACLCLAAAGLRAQSATGPSRFFDAATLGDRVELNHGWLFHAGDDSSWASPTLDDQDWKAIDLKKPLEDYGVAPDIHYCWLRLHIKVPPGGYPPLRIMLDETIGNYEIYVNGVLAGSFGDMTGHRWSYRGDAPTYLFPQPRQNANEPALDLVAIRFAVVEPLSEGSIPPPQSPMMYAAAALGSLQSFSIAKTAKEQKYSGQYNKDTVAQTLIGLIAAAFFLYQKKDREFGWLAMANAASACVSASNLQTILDHSDAQSTLLFATFEVIASIGFLMFAWSLLHLRHMWIPVVLILPVLVHGAGASAWGYGLIRHYPQAGMGWSESFLDICFLVSSVIVPSVLIISAAMRANRDAAVLAPACLLQLLTGLLYFAHSFRWTNWSPTLTIAHIEFGYIAFANAFQCLSFVVFLVMRMIQTARQSDRATAELAAAQTVQQLLLVNDKEHLPGFAVDTAYLPANEVGGDFFLVSAGPDGSLTALVGDVAGKGLQAAMRVSMIVGALRREASREPATILNNLNLVLLAERQSGFTTACCVHLLTDGTLTVANAGHLSPVLIGGEGARELDTAPALPLGLAEGTVSQTTGCLQHGERLMLCSDGVPEARNRKTRELMGFGRMLELAGESADSIANAAKAFGQEDDITVLTIALR